MLLMLNSSKKTSNIIVHLLQASSCTEQLMNILFNAYSSNLRQKHFFLSSIEGNTVSEMLSYLPKSHS